MLPIPSSEDADEGSDEVDALVDRFQALWSAHPPADLEAYVRELGDRATPYVVGMLAKVDLQQRFDRGDPAPARPYLDRYSVLASDNDRAVSLIYEEYCLLEETGRRPDPESFCRRYATWADSLASQLNYHQALSVVSGREPRTAFPSPGDRFAKYKLDAILGQGGSARVFLAQDDGLGGRKFVLKVSPDHGAEPRILGRMVHRNIIPVHSVEVEPTSGLRGLRMPYYPGPPLDAVSSRIQGHLPPAKAAELFEMILEAAPGPRPETPGWADFPMKDSYARGVAWLGLKLAEALAHAHDQGILHRDVKPANVLLSVEHGPQLLDFNLAQAPNSAEEAAQALRGGTVPYMSPEQLRAFQNPERWTALGPPSDIYALGLVLSELLTGDAPRKPRSRVPLPRAIQDALDQRFGPQKPLHRRNPAVPRALSEIVGKCLAFEPGDRYASAGELADDLRRFLERRRPRHVRYRAPLESTKDWFLRRNRHRRVVAAVVLILIGAGFAYRPAKTALQIQSARRHMRSADYGAALGELLPILDAHPDRVDLRIEAAQALEMLNAPAKAQEFFATAVKDPRSIDFLAEASARRPDSKSLGMALGHAHHHLKNYAAAASAFENVSRRFPDDADARLALHVCHYEMRRWNEALADVDAAVRLIAASTDEPDRICERLAPLLRGRLESLRMLSESGDARFEGAAEAIALADAEWFRDAEVSPKARILFGADEGLVALVQRKEAVLRGDPAEAARRLDRARERAEALRRLPPSSLRDVETHREAFLKALAEAAPGI